jgi:hypothetical protein
VEREVDVEENLNCEKIKVTWMVKGEFKKK